MNWLLGAAKARRRQRGCLRLEQSASKSGSSELLDKSEESSRRLSGAGNRLFASGHRNWGQRCSSVRDATVGLTFSARWEIRSELLFVTGAFVL